MTLHFTGIEKKSDKKKHSAQDAVGTHPLGHLPPFYFGTWIHKPDPMLKTGLRLVRKVWPLGYKTERGIAGEASAEPQNECLLEFRAPGATSAHASPSPVRKGQHRSSCRPVIVDVVLEGRLSFLAKLLWIEGNSEFLIYI